MPQTTECGSCGKAIRLPDDSAGKKIKCGDCETVHKIAATDGGTLYLVSLAPRPEADEVAESPVVRSRASRGGRRSSGRKSSGGGKGGRVANVRTKGGGRPGRGGRRAPANNLVPAIIVTLCCFPITGIVAIIYAVKVDSAWLAGRDEQARRYAQSAKTWIIVSIILSLVAGALQLIFFGPQAESGF